MKNKIIFLLSAALLLTSLSAFAEKMTSQKTTIMNNTSVNSNIKTSLQNVYEENKAKEASPEDKIKEICKNDKYCLEAGSFFLFIINDMLEKDDPNDLLENMLGEMLESLKGVKNYKQRLYDIEYISSLISLRHYLLDFEARKLEKLTKFDEIKEYILDMPMTYHSFIKAVKKMKETASSKKELDFVDSFMNKYTGKLFPQNYEIFREEDLLELIKNSNPFCPHVLIVDNYGYDNLCTLPFKPAIKEPQNDIIVPMKTKNFGNPTKKHYSPKAPKPEEEPKEEEEIFASL